MQTQKERLENRLLFMATREFLEPMSKRFPNQRTMKLTFSKHTWFTFTLNFWHCPENKTPNQYFPRFEDKDLSSIQKKDQYLDDWPKDYENYGNVYKRAQYVQKEGLTYSYIYWEIFYSEKKQLLGV